MRRALAMAAVVALGALSGAAMMAGPQIDRCPEDAVLVGYGAFEDGRYARYECGPAFDDYDPAL